MTDFVLSTTHFEYRFCTQCDQASPTRSTRCTRSTHSQLNSLLNSQVARPSFRRARTVRANYSRLRHESCYLRARTSSDGKAGRHGGVAAGTPTPPRFACHFALVGQRRRPLKRSNGLRRS